ncbi:osmoprotectant transport system substrate-binding protein [Streptomyces sp. PgraA7]|nr:osmoprotectant transport system substrate-binding protein [Streptomyces sp. PgraA7]
MLTTKDLTELNCLVDKDRKDPEDVAYDWAAEHGIRK